MRRLAVLFAVMSINGCACLFDGFAYDFDAGALPHLADGGSLTLMHPDCVPLREDVSAAQLLDVTHGAPVTDGVVESPVTSTGCVVVRDEYRGGRRVSVSLLQYVGLVVLDEDTQLYGEGEWTYLSVTLDGAGSLHATFDLDGNGKRDALVDEVRAGGLLQSRTATQFDDANDGVTRRETMTVLDVDHMTFKVEQLVAGELVVVSDFTASTTQNQVSGCYQPRPPGQTDTVGCGKTDAELRTLVHDALASYVSCLSSYGSWSFAQLEAFVLDDIKTPEMNIECFRDPTYFGQALSARDTLRLNVDMISCANENPTFVNSTIVHEMLHFTRGPHEFDSPSGPYGPRAAAYSDPMRACEELCYGTLKTKCSCARCLGVKACDSRCSGLPSCRVDPADGGAPTMSEAVGAHCPSTNTWFSTMASCGAATGCPGGKSNCKSYSVSCDSSCQ